MERLKSRAYVSQATSDADDQNIEIVVEELPQEEKTIKYWHIVKEREATPVKTYVSKEEALADPESRAKMVLSAYKELRNFGRSTKNCMS